MGQILKAIGPTFGAEVISSRAAGLPFSWGPDSIDWEDGALTDTQIAELRTIVAAHDASGKASRLATGKQLSEALAGLGQLAVWDTAVVATRKPGDRYYWLNAYRDLVPENNAKIGRLAASAGVSVSALFDKAVTDPAV